MDRTHESRLEIGEILAMSGHEIGSETSRRFVT